MNPKLLLLASKLLQMAADEFSNHGCNDLDDDFFDGWTKPELKALCEEMREWNGDGDDPWPEHPSQLGDDGLMSFLAAKLSAAAEIKPGTTEEK